MSTLGDILEVVYGPSDKFQTVRATIRHWRNKTLARRAALGRAPFGKLKTPAEASQVNDESFFSVWIRLPDRFRIESRDQNSRRPLEILNGDRSWTCDDQGHVNVDAGGASKKRRGAPGATCTDRHFSRASLREFFVGLSLEAVGEVRTAGYDCLRLQARVRDSGRLWPHWLPCGADEYEFQVEPVRGVVLAILGRNNGEVFETNEVTEAVFDEPLDESLFRYEPRYGEQLRPKTPSAERLSLTDAIARVPFTVFLPTSNSSSNHGELDVWYHPASGSHGPTLMISPPAGYETQDRYMMSQSAMQEADRSDLEWEEIVRDGQTLRITDPEVDRGYRGVTLERSGTRVLIWSNDIPRETLLDFAASLVPASA